MPLPPSPEFGILQNGRRRIKAMDQSNNGPPIQGPVRHISFAQLDLQRVYEQNRANDEHNKAMKEALSKGKAPTKAPKKLQPAPGPAARGKPRLLLMGQRRSGKSSISSVVFHKMPPNETLFLESTTRIQKDAMHSFMDFQVWDFPGQINFQDQNFDAETIFGEIGALIWVIDAQDDYVEALGHLIEAIGHLHDPESGLTHINIEVFIHKVDGLSDEYREDVARDIRQRIEDELSDAQCENAPVNYHTTSIYNHSIFEAFSKVIQKLIPHLPTLESLLNDLCSACKFEKAYLFDVLSKIYIATDTSPVDMPSYEICSDFIDVIVDISEIFGWPRSQEYIDGLEGPPWNKSLEDQVACPDAEAAIVLTQGKRPILLREVNKYLALVAICKEGSYEKQPLITMNVETTVQGLAKVFEITKARQ